MSGLSSIACLAQPSAASPATTSTRCQQFLTSITKHKVQKRNDIGLRSSAHKLLSLRPNPLPADWNFELSQ
eukprot:3649635-Amphidinium_carterae.1